MKLWLADVEGRVGGWGGFRHSLKRMPRASTTPETQRLKMCFSAITPPLPLQAHVRKDTPMAPPPLLPVLSLSSWSVVVTLNRAPALPWSSLSDWIFKLPDIFKIISIVYLWSSRFIFLGGRGKKNYLSISLLTEAGSFSLTIRKGFIIIIIFILFIFLFLVTGRWGVGTPTSESLCLHGC